MRMPSGLGGAICTYESYLTDKVLPNLVRLIFYTKHSRLILLFLRVKVWGARVRHVSLSNSQQASFLPVAHGGIFRSSAAKGWWARQDSNLQQHGYEPWVLTNWTTGPPVSYSQPWRLAVLACADSTANSNFRGSYAISATVRDVSACATPLPQSVEYVRGSR